MASNITRITRKNLWFSLREKYPNLTIRRSVDFKNAVHERLIHMSKLVQPLNFDEDKFISNEANSFGNMVPTYWAKAKWNLRTMFKQHEKYFDKDCTFPQRSVLDLEPDVVPDLEPPSPLKRPYESKSKVQKWRDRSKLAKTEGKDAIIETAASLFEKEGHSDASFVLKRLHKDPGLGTQLRKMIESLDNDETNNNDRLIYLCLNWL